MVTKSNGYEVDGYIPDGQTSRGTEQFPSPNPKDASQRRRDGVPSDLGDSGQSQSGAQVETTSRNTNYGGNTFSRGSDAAVPSPEVVNSNYALTADQVPEPTNVSAYRSYDVQPYELPSPDGDTRNTPGLPRDVPGTGDQS